MAVTVRRGSSNSVITFTPIKRTELKRRSEMIELFIASSIMAIINNSISYNKPLRVEIMTVFLGLVGLALHEPFV